MPKPQDKYKSLLDRLAENVQTDDLIVDLAPIRPEKFRVALGFAQAGATINPEWLNLSMEVESSTEVLDEQPTSFVSSLNVRSKDGKTIQDYYISCRPKKPENNS